MMGRQTSDQAQLFYEFCLEDRVPDNHLLRRINGSVAAALAVDASVMEADASRYHGQAPDEIDWSKIEKPSRAVREYLEALDEAGELEPGRKPPKVVSPSDPESAWTPRPTSACSSAMGLTT